MENEQKLHLREDYGKGVSLAIKTDLTKLAANIDLIKARFDYPSIRSMNQNEWTVFMDKIISDTMDYFGVSNDRIIELLKTDIKAKYGSWTIVDIAKAIQDGRSSGEQIYGKLNGSHIMKWLRDYDVKSDEEISNYRRNESVTKMIRVDNDEKYKELLANQIRRMAEIERSRKTENEKKIEQKKGDFGVFVKPPSARMLAIREWQDIEGVKPALEDYLKDKQV